MTSLSAFVDVRSKCKGSFQIAVQKLKPRAIIEDENPTMQVLEVGRSVRVEYYEPAPSTKTAKAPDSDDELMNALDNINRADNDASNKRFIVRTTADSESMSDHSSDPSQSSDDDDDAAALSEIALTFGSDIVKAKKPITIKSLDYKPVKNGHEIFIKGRKPLLGKVVV